MGIIAPGNNGAIVPEREAPLATGSYCGNAIEVDRVIALSVLVAPPGDNGAIVSEPKAVIASRSNCPDMEFQVGLAQ